MKTKVVGVVLFSALIISAFLYIGGCNNSNGSGGSMADSVENEFTPIISSFVTKPIPYSAAAAQSWGNTVLF